MPPCVYFQQIPEIDSLKQANNFLIRCYLFLHVLHYDSTQFKANHYFEVCFEGRIQKLNTVFTGSLINCPQETTLKVICFFQTTTH
jgi:hypothetical protein